MVTQFKFLNSKPVSGAMLVWGVYSTGTLQDSIVSGAFRSGLAATRPEHLRFLAQPY